MLSLQSGLILLIYLKLDSFPSLVNPNLETSQKKAPLRTTNPPQIHIVEKGK